MLYLFGSVLCLGFLYPVGKIFIDSGLSTIAFCVLFLGCRVLLQIPFGLMNVRKFSWNASLGGIFLAAGIIGALLHWIEFRSLELGVEVAKASFLVFSYPASSLLIRRVFGGRKFSTFDYAKVALALFGMLLIVHPWDSAEVSVPISYYLLPISASVLISLWILCSEVAMKRNSNTVQFSIVYDSLTLFFLTAILFAGGNSGEHLTQIATWLREPWNVFGMLTYALIVGVLANVLFYYGIKRVDGWLASLVLLLEPVFATVISSYLFAQPLGLDFVIGSTLVFLSNSTRDQWKQLLRPVRVKQSHRRAISGPPPVIAEKPLRQAQG